MFSELDPAAGFMSIIACSDFMSSVISKFLAIFIQTPRIVRRGFFAFDRFASSEMAAISCLPL